MKVIETNIVVVNNSLNNEDYGYLNNDIFATKKSDVLRIIYSGRITEAKKISLLIEALGIIKSQGLFDFKCHIIGDGDKVKLISLSKKLNVFENLDFPGAKYGKEIHSYFLDSDLYVYPGGIGLSLLHALSFGLPVITTDNMNSHFPEVELLKPGFNGDFFRDNSAEALASNIISWRERLLHLRIQYKNNCIQSIKEYDYLPEIMKKKILDFLLRKATYVRV